ncbi:citrate synthase [Bacillus paranthracis]|uniref:Citrate synthase n=14 Tax=Bacillus cereus group TaxID=86661 RepID=A0A7D8D5D7_9BACI|nr:MULTISPECIES: citrate synthase [Bacillus]ACJ77372.1 citrate synthase CitZ [Bacillus cereus AH187]EDX58135.1 citrate synthase CitZ [Bacillus cereus W]EDX66988.1 citrate synthase CitZ [Bacillus cereus NVH0597-99]EEK42885.1 Citrate synthase 2 [Bacillus cereus m1293]EEK98394.1 Citrate synthase 2 [Bacillus cereus BDRD-ST26]EJP93495.1 citrate synthase 2 [Bacillus cereus IS075]EJQ04468.1 citrate synthase 2 [Bacillus cereus AND1407]EJR10287.1 citrate synthase 2 [Bacillus cereus MSX-A12]EOO93421
MGEFSGKGENVMTVIRGLEGVVATTSSVSSIIDDTLTYVGYNIDDLAENATFEEVVYLLWHRKLPNEQELAKFNEIVSEYYKVPGEILAYLKQVDLKIAHPMSVLRTAISMLSLYDESAEIMDEKSNYLKAVKLQAQVGTLVAAYARIRKGLDVVEPRNDLSLAANFLYMLNDREPNEVEIEAFDKALVLHADHELNASTFTARVCVATLSDVYSGITAAIGALKGPLHGGANENVMKMLTEIGEEENVESYIHNALQNKVKIMGFGHRVYEQGDPRAKHLREMSKRLCVLLGEEKWYNMSIKIEDIVTKEKGLPPNVDFYSASVYHCLGIDHDLFTPIFAISRMSGWLAHILEQYENNRLIRPRADYNGPTHQVYVPIAQR